MMKCEEQNNNFFKKKMQTYIITFIVLCLLMCSVAAGKKYENIDKLAKNLAKYGE